MKTYTSAYELGADLRREGSDEEAQNICKFKPNKYISRNPPRQLEANYITLLGTKIDTNEDDVITPANLFSHNKWFFIDINLIFCVRVIHYKLCNKAHQFLKLGL